MRAPADASRGEGSVIIDTLATGGLLGLGLRAGAGVCWKGQCALAFGAVDGLGWGYGDPTLLPVTRAGSAGGPAGLVVQPSVGVAGELGIGGVLGAELALGISPLYPVDAATGVYGAVVPDLRDPAQRVEGDPWDLGLPLPWWARTALDGYLAYSDAKGTRFHGSAAVVLRPGGGTEGAWSSVQFWAGLRVHQAGAHVADGGRLWVPPIGWWPVSGLSPSVGVGGRWGAPP